LAVAVEPEKSVAERPAEAVRLTRSFYPKFFLTFSPDGSHLTYSRHHANKRASKAVLMELRIVDADGKNDRPLLKEFEREVQIQEHPAWSPDGKHVAISGGGSSLGNAAKDVFICDIADFSASKLRPLVSGSQRLLVEEPSWSPDGKQLVVKDHAKMTLALLDADGRNLREITKQSGSYLENPVWSPDGQLIAFASDRDGNCEIYTITPRGTDLTRVTNHASTDCHPRWSPDGRWIAFTSYRDRDSEIYVVRPDGSGLRNLTRHPGHDDFPAWSPDGRWLAFVSARDGAFDIYYLPVPADLRVASQPPAQSKQGESPTKPPR
jgi:TolB protein